MTYKKPNIFICGPSGSGKSTSLRNLNPDRTIILNTENQELPFKSASKFTKQVFIKDFTHFNKVFQSATKSKSSDVIVIDSFLSFTEMAYEHIVRPVDRVGDNVLQAWEKYKNAVRDVLNHGKLADKFIVFLGIDDLIQDEKNRIHRVASVQGQWKGKVEKEFQIVLWTRAIQAETGIEYVYCTNTDGQNKAKTPMDMFEEQYIPNDLQVVLTQIHKYYTED